MRVSSYFIWRYAPERDSKDEIAICRWHIAATSSKTGCYLHFCPMGRNANESLPVYRQTVDRNINQTILCTKEEQSEPYLSRRRGYPCGYPLLLFGATRRKGTRKMKSQYAGGILLQPVQKLVATSCYIAALCA